MENPKLPNVFSLESSITSANLKDFISRDYLDTPFYHIRAPCRNEMIVLPDPPPPSLVDPQKDLSLVFFIKQQEYGLNFPFTPFFNEVFRYFEITPRMLAPNSILFMCSFESVCLSWGFTPTAPSNVKMDQIKPPKNFTLSRESMNAALDALLAGRSVGETEAGSKRPLPSNAPVPVPKKSRASRHTAPALPPLEKEKTAVVPLLSAPDNDILNAEDITHQSPTSVVAEIIKERMFGGVTEASDPHLLALTSLLATSTREQAAFRSRPRRELGDTIREMLLMLMGLFTEVDARDHSLRESVDRRIEEARLEENLSATSNARGNLAAAREHSKSLQAELTYAKEALKRAEGRAAVAEISRDEALKQLSSLEEIRRERDEAMSQKEEVQHQHELLKVDFEGAQAHCEAVMAQQEEAWARMVVLEQELSKHADNVKGLTLAAEESKLQNQQLCQQVKVLEKRCSALLEDAKLAEDRVQLECEELLREYKGVSQAEERD
ncbi:uncharacterized protein LOC122723984 [Manihot esculenta]|uniref:uncharacterized protein LOC122723984 n=1 Tax=Manihot esculenta TaxID=3983 RepID=UPI001CC35AD9|nr:uncharacterized protein LOC122723984 [Manihot esculenta]